MTVINLYVNLFTDGTALLELHPQGDAHQAIPLPAGVAGQLLQLARTPEASAALASLFLAGVQLGERQARTSTRPSPAALQLQQDLVTTRRIVESLAERVAVQSEQLTRRAERSTPAIAGP